MTRFCFPTDIPIGARLVEHDLTIADLSMWRNDDGSVVAVCDEAMRTVLLDPAVRVEIDEDTPARAARLRFAHTLLGLLVTAAVFCSTAIADDGGARSYSGRQNDVVAATVALYSADVPRGGVAAVWLGAQDKAGDWVQAGVGQMTGTAFAPDGSPFIYAETMDVKTKTHRLVNLGQISYGQQVQVRLSFSYRHGWVVWLNGKAVASLHLDAGAWHYAIAESYLGATMQYTILPGSTL